MKIIKRYRLWYINMKGEPYSIEWQFFTNRNEVEYYVNNWTKNGIVNDLIAVEEFVR